MGRREEEEEEEEGVAERGAGVTSSLKIQPRSLTPVKVSSHFPPLSPLSHAPRVPPYTRLLAFTVLMFPL